MTTGERLNQISYISNGTAAEHLLSVLAGDILINTDEIFLKESEPVHITEKSDIIKIINLTDTKILEDEDKIILEDGKVNINGIC